VLAELIFSFSPGFNPAQNNHPDELRRVETRREEEKPESISV